MRTPEYDRDRVGEYLGLGAGFAASALLFTLLGWFLDSRIGTTPVFTLIGVLIGGAAGFYNLYRRAVAFQDRQEPKKDDEEDGSPQP